jgi:hypothetical protein
MQLGMLLQPTWMVVLRAALLLGVTLSPSS